VRRTTSPSKVLGVDEAHRLLVAGLAEEALAGWPAWRDDDRRLQRRLREV
jgi:hypothetical protein